MSDIVYPEKQTNSRKLEREDPLVRSELGATLNVFCIEAKKILCVEYME